ncbi:MAG: hypothetical protein K0Q67_2325, partial [Cellvibrio sp.]|nr:hypothetical protein [Cellvibrio sp.]
ALSASAKNKIIIFINFISLLAGLEALFFIHPVP